MRKQPDTIENYNGQGRVNPPSMRKRQQEEEEEEPEETNQ